MIEISQENGLFIKVDGVKAPVRVCTRQETIQILKLNRGTFYYHINETGKIRSYKRGAYVYVNHSDVLKLLEKARNK